MLLHAAAALLLLTSAAAETSVGHVSKVPIYLLDLGDGPTYGLVQIFAITDVVVKYINDMETILPAYELKVIHRDTEVRIGMGLPSRELRLEKIFTRH